jgi:hypothetical protein
MSIPEVPLAEELPDETAYLKQPETVTRMRMYIYFGYG